MTFNFPLGLGLFITVINFKGTKPRKKVNVNSMCKCWFPELMSIVFFYYTDFAFSAFLYVRIMVRIIEIFRHTFQCRYHWLECEEIFSIFCPFTTICLLFCSTFAWVLHVCDVYMVQLWRLKTGPRHSCLVCALLHACSSFSNWPIVRPHKSKRAE